MTYTYPTGRTAREVYEELYSGPKYGAGEHGGGAEWMCEGFKSLLDVGGGKTPTAARYAAHAKMQRVTVCDISEKALRKQPRGVVRVHCDISEGLPFHDNEFDLITCFDVMEHIQPDAVDFVIQEMGRVAKRRLILSIAHIPANQDRLAKNRNQPLHLTLHPQPWWLAKLRDLLGAKVTVHKCVRRIKHGRPRYGDTILVELPQ